MDALTRPLALLLNADGSPVTIDLALRASECGDAAPGRLKARFITELGEGTKIRKPDGEIENLKQLDGDKEDGFVALTPEFRIESAN